MGEYEGEEVSSTSESSPDDAGSAYGRRVGERLRAIRRQKGLSLQDVEANSEQEFKASVLGAYERGERAISVPRLERLARYYSVPVDQLLPRSTSSPPRSNLLDLTGKAGRTNGAGAGRPARCSSGPGAPVEPRRWLAPPVRRLRGRTP